MKKLNICLYLILLISCESLDTSQEVIPSPTQPFLEEVQELNNFYVQGINMALDALDNKNLDIKHNAEVALVEEVLFMDIVNVMAKEMIVFKEDGKNEFHNQYKKMMGISNRQARERGGKFNAENFYSEKQTEILNPFINSLEISNSPLQSKNIAESFQAQIINSGSLNYEEKISLLTISSGTIVFSKFILDDGIEKIKEKLIIDHEDQIQALGCSVNMRNVWLAAVIGGGAGAIGGAKVGCAGGMVGGPIGAAGGCVGGAVMGGAVGFISSALMGTGAELLGSCFR
mgnify:CR=1 FL=1|tara:strand:- start:8957 stop:9817 length:861 start_codon:yes stop_codon:yes gene_type:complete